MEEKEQLPAASRSLSGSAAHNPVMTSTLKLRFYRLCNVVMELERMQPVIDAVQTIAEVVALLPF